MIEAAVLTCVIAFACLVLSDTLRPKVEPVETPIFSNHLPEQLPAVTVQVPVYREEQVLERQIVALLQLRYPSELLTIQVLDDSPEPYASTTRGIVERYADSARSIKYLNRGSRQGCKAGALNFGLRQATSDLVAIFDVDCTPDPDFLLKVVPHFSDPAVAAVQTRFRFRQRPAAALSYFQLAIFAYLFHFEERGRSQRGMSAWFLGTAGVWRRRILSDVGPWQEAPFTSEDIDMSFRCSKGNSKVVYVDEDLATADLVERYSDFKDQQRRWARGGLRVSIDHGSSAFKSPEGLRNAICGLRSLVLHFSAVLFVMLLPFHIVALGVGFGGSIVWKVAELLCAALLLLVPARVVHVHQILYRHHTTHLFGVVVYFAGWSLSTCLGFADTLIGSNAPFARTRKSAEGIQTASLSDAAPMLLIEMTFAILALLACYLCVTENRWESAPFAVGTALMYGSSLVESVRDCTRSQEHLALTSSRSVVD